MNGVPSTSPRVMPALVCRDVAAEIDFCKTVLDAEERVRRPGPDGSPIHAALAVGEALIMIQAEFPGEAASRAPQPDGSSPVVLFVYVPDVDQAVERAVQLGAQVLIPLTKQFWGDRTARVLDPAGHVWTLASRIEETTAEERTQRWSEMLDESRPPRK